MDTMTSLRDVERAEAEFGKDSPTTELLRKSYQGIQATKEMDERRFRVGTGNRPIRPEVDQDPA